MKIKPAKTAFNKEYFLFLLPVFFFLHRLTQNYLPALIETTIFVAVKYILIIIALVLILNWIFKSFRKVAVLIFALMAFYFLFGPVHDYLKQLFPGFFFVKYTFIIPISLLLFSVLAMVLIRTKSNLNRVTIFLNILFTAFILLDLALLLKANSGMTKEADLALSLKNCNNCNRPDIYLIVADEYAGNKQLKDLFSFDNSGFESELETRGFHVVKNSISNYNATVYSIASMLNMNYIENLESRLINHRDMFLCKEIINENNLTELLNKSDYDLYNFSFFNLSGKINPVSNPFFVSQTKFLTSETFVNRLIKDVSFNFSSQEEIDKLKWKHHYNNIKIEKLLKESVLQKSKKPKFVYTHLAMPHHPYYLDSTGKEVLKWKITPGYAQDKNAYIQYLVYTNKKLLQLVDHIKSNSDQPPVIILMSDHGYRQLDEDHLKPYFFMNLNAVLLPGKDYSQFYEGMSNVNQFRVILNAEFKQNLPLLKDSTTFLIE